jgi:hypothetical protein
MALESAELTGDCAPTRVAAKRPASIAAATINFSHSPELRMDGPSGVARALRRPIQAFALSKVEPFLRAIADRLVGIVSLHSLAAIDGAARLSAVEH